MRCCGTEVNHNLWLNLVIAALMGFAESIWTNTIGVAFLYDVFGQSNTKVGVATALTGLAAMATALPAGWAADTYRRSAVIRVGASLVLVAAPLYAYGVVGAAAGGNKAASYAIICAASALFGVAQGITHGPAEALLADSVPTGQRSKSYNWLFVSYIVPSVLGPLISVVYFTIVGDRWRLAALRDLMLVGLALEVPVGLFSCAFRDDRSLGKSSDAVQDQDGAPSIVGADASGDVALVSGGGDDAGDDGGDGDDGRAAADPRVRSIPYVVFATDLVVAIGSGMTVKYFPLFFKNDCGMTPAQVQAIYVAVPLAMVAASTGATKLGKVLGRVEACVESQPIQDTFNLSVPERIFKNSLSSRRDLGERMRTVQESWETSSI